MQVLFQSLDQLAHKAGDHKVQKNLYKDNNSMKHNNKDHIIHNKIHIIKLINC